MRPLTRYRLSFLAPLLAIAGAFAAGDALAWSAEGHRIVARIAEAGLTPAARAEVDRLLADETDPTLAGWWKNYTDWLAPYLVPTGTSVAIAAGLQVAAERIAPMYGPAGPTAPLSLLHIGRCRPP